MCTALQEGNGKPLDVLCRKSKNMTSSTTETRDSSRSFRTPDGSQNLNATREGISRGVNCNYDDGSKPDCSSMKQPCRDPLKRINQKKLKKKRRLKNILNIGTWNVQTMLEGGKTFFYYAKN